MITIEKGRKFMVDIRSLPNRPPRSPGSFSASGPANKPSVAPAVSGLGAVNQKGEDVSSSQSTGASIDNDNSNTDKKPFSWGKILLIIVVLLLFLGGGFYWWQKRGTPVVSGQEVTLTYWGLWETESVMAGLIEKLEKVRCFLGIPLIISSGIRCEKMNVEVGGVWDSYHKLGRAVDILVYEANGFSVDEVANAGERYGLKTIRYYDQSFVHFQYND
jgi:hypothetical protein